MIISFKILYLPAPYCKPKFSASAGLTSIWKDFYMEGVSRKGDSKIQIRDRKDLLHVLTDRDTFVKILQQVDDSFNTTEYRDITSGHDNNSILDYFMRLLSRSERVEILLE